MALNQRVVIAFRVPGLADRYMSATTVRCRDCGHRFQAAYDHGATPGLIDPDVVSVQLVDHGRRSPIPHPSLFLSDRRSA